ncbi:hypothetical protein [Paenibacillus foliorum]|nr:hypothetical protein [Paenibacillus foliorum]
MWVNSNSFVTPEKWQLPWKDGKDDDGDMYPRIKDIIMYAQNK